MELRCPPFMQLRVSLLEPAIRSHNKWVGWMGNAQRSSAHFVYQFMVNWPVTTGSHARCEVCTTITYIICLCACRKDRGVWGKKNGWNCGRELHHKLVFSTVQIKITLMGINTTDWGEITKIVPSLQSLFFMQSF